MQNWFAIPALLDIRPSIVSPHTNPLGLAVAGILLSLAVIFVGRMVWKRANKS